MAHMKRRDANKPRREQRQAEAKVRQEIYAGLTAQQKLDGLPPAGALKQRKRLLETGGPRRSAVMQVASEAPATPAVTAPGKPKKPHKTKK